MTTWSTGAFRTINHDVSLALAALAPASLRESLGYKPALSRRHADAPGGASPSGKAPVFGTGIRRFESCRPSQLAGFASTGQPRRREYFACAAASSHLHKNSFGIQ